jgi:hypothetical protein
MTFHTSPSDRALRNRSGNRVQSPNQIVRGRFTPKGTVSTPQRQPCSCCVAETLGASPAEALEGYRIRELKAIEKFGFSIRYVDDEDNDHVPWAYTVGHTRRGLPELLIVGVDSESAHQLLSSLSAHSFPFQPQRSRALLELHFPHLRFLEVPGRVWDDTEYLLGAAADARTFAPRQQRTALQVVWSDTNGAFPWEPTFEECFVDLQPIVGLSKE